MRQRLGQELYEKDVLEVAPNLLGKVLVRKHEGSVLMDVIVEVEAYRGEEDKACHAKSGMTSRTKVMYGKGGRIYVYLIYGMYWMLNVVTGAKDQPQAVLIRGLKNIKGPGKIGKWLSLDKTFYGEDLTTSQRIWLEDPGTNILESRIRQTPRIGVEYAEKWAEKPWRFVLDEVDGPDDLIK